MKNLANMHAKKSKCSMMDREKQERRAAKKTEKSIAECKANVDEIGRGLARGFGVMQVK